MHLHLHMCIHPCIHICRGACIDGFFNLQLHSCFCIYPRPHGGLHLSNALGSRGLGFSVRTPGCGGGEALEEGSFCKPQEAQSPGYGGVVWDPYSPVFGIPNPPPPPVPTQMGFTDISPSVLSLLVLICRNCSSPVETSTRRRARGATHFGKADG